MKDPQALFVESTKKFKIVSFMRLLIVTFSSETMLRNNISKFKSCVSIPFVNNDQMENYSSQGFPSYQDFTRGLLFFVKPLGIFNCRANMYRFSDRI